MIHISLLKLTKRFFQMVIVLFFVSFFTFLLTYLAPGDPASAMFAASGIVPSEDMLKAARHSMGLDKPFVLQYTSWLTNCLAGDFGTSFSKKTPVAALLSQRLWPTLKLALFSLVLMLALSLPAGIVSAVRQNKFTDYLFRGFSFVGISMPGFWIGLLLLYIFALKLNLLPVISTTAGWKRLVLPGVTLAIAMASKYSRQVRAAVLEELQQDYVVGAKARGIKPSVIMIRHVLPNALLPLVTMLGLSLGSLLGGTAVVEIVFAYPGLGNLAVNAVGARDYPLIQGIVLWIAMIYMIINLLVDLSYSLIDPRIRKEA